MSSHDGHRLVSAWLPAPFERAVTQLAKARGESKSKLIRRALVREAHTPVEKGETDDR
jgi:hypothetical protein